MENVNELEVEEENAKKALQLSEKSYHAKRCGELFIEAIKNKDHYFAVDEKTGRIFNHSVNAPKTLRPFLRHKGEKLVEIDIKNCQPLLLNSIYRQKSAESEKFKYCTEVLDFYDYIGLNADFKDIPREKIKIKFFKFIFGWGVHDEIAPIYKLFEKEFPILLWEMKKIKKGNYKSLALLLQRREAEAIINHTVTFARKNKIPVFPIHDSFMLHIEHAQLIKQEIIRVFQELYQITPNIKQKDLQSTLDS